MNFELSTDSMRFAFSDLGGELISAKSRDSLEYIWQGDKNSWERHAPMLFPFCGRLKDSKYSFNEKEYSMGCHGFLAKSKMTATKISDSSISFSFSDNDLTRKSYPFNFNITTTYKACNNTLSVNVLIENTGDVILPFMFGAHPGFNLPLDKESDKEDYFIDLGCDKCTVHGLDKEQCFVSQAPKEYVFKDKLFKIDEAEIEKMGTAIFSGVKNEAKLFSPNGKHSVIINYSDEFKYFCIWKFPSPEAKFICLEPWTGIPGNGIENEILETRNSMIRINPNETKALSYSITFN